MKRTAEDYHNLAADILKRLRMGTLATASPSGKPWNTPLLIERDAALRLYWFSDRQGRHSRNVRQNKHVFVVFYNSTVDNGQGRCGGVYVKAVARELTDPEEIRRACRVHKNDSDYPKQFMAAAIRRVYVAEPEEIWINEIEERDGIFIRDYRVKLSIASLRALLRSSA